MEREEESHETTVKAVKNPSRVEPYARRVAEVHDHARVGWDVLVPVGLEAGEAAESRHHVGKDCIAEGLQACAEAIPADGRGSKSKECRHMPGDGEEGDEHKNARREFVEEENGDEHSEGLKRVVEASGHSARAAAA